jgi:hypothetical protein
MILPAGTIQFNPILEFKILALKFPFLIFRNFEFLKLESWDFRN